MSPARRRASSSSDPHQERQMKVAAREKAKRDVTTSLSMAWNGQGWIPDDIRNCRRSPGSGTTDLTILRLIWRVTQKAVSMNISLLSLWQPDGVLRESYSDSAPMWRKNLHQAARDESWSLGAPRPEGNQFTERTHQSDLADIVTVSDQDKPRHEFGTEDEPMADGDTEGFQETSAHVSADEASICIWGSIDGSSIEELEEQGRELKIEAGHATTRIMRTKELPDNIRGKIAALSDVQLGVKSLLDNGFRRPDTSTPDMKEHVKFLEDASQQRKLSLDKELAEVLNEERASHRDLYKIREKQKLIAHILNYKAAIERSDV
ncbi:unnamed protein product [Clonostachys solani]|uniref:Uncharacterized protein n=1 Tax=Clonostachys solani TaxID=160281 RepID=A0A9N9Z0X1_9HYPO|nr:unnamed protein product [Clonostachys solani]